jgi:hypothetical protein
VRQAACELIAVIGQCSLSVPPPQPPAAAVSSLWTEEEEWREEEREQGSLSRVVSQTQSQSPPLGLFLRVLCAGLEDSWCQVRLASTQAAGVLLRWVKHLCPPGGGGGHFLPLWVLLVPRLCLNRHYSTESVR